MTQNQNGNNSASARANGRFRVLGVPVDAVQIPGVVGQISRWIDERHSTRYVAVTGMHGITESLRDPHFRLILKAADLVVPDGMPLVWIGRLRGRQMKRRVYGPELMETFCRETGPRYRHFFYGGAPGVPEDLAHVMQERHGIQVAGAYSPPFRPLSVEEDRELVDLIHAASPDVLWVGLSTPKQERWMYEHRDKIRVPAMLGVGAAFDLNTKAETSAALDARKWPGMVLPLARRAQTVVASLLGFWVSLCFQCLSGIPGSKAVRISRTPNRR